MRKLAVVCLSFSAAVAAANYILPMKHLLLMSAAIACIAFVMFLVLRKNYRFWAVGILFFAIGLSCFSYHNSNTVMAAEKYAGKTLGVTAEVLDFPEIYDDYCRLYVKVKSKHIPNLKAYLYDNDKEFASVKPGDMIYVCAKINAADTLYGQHSDTYHSKGIYFKLESEGKAEITRNFNAIYLPQYLSHFLSSRINEIFPDDTEVFMRSLMIGDKSDFYDDERLYASLYRSGLMHIVAVSGMHISFLAAMLQSILGRSRKSALICIVFLWIFALVTGAGVSIVRAAFMHTYYLMAPILRRENDSITSLAVILAVLLFVNPFAIASISLQLSFGAMCGIVLFSEKIEKELVLKFVKLSEYPIFRSIIASVSCSLSVMVFTVPLTAIHFETVQLLSPLTNLLSLWAVSLSFCWGWISCALSFVPVAGEISALLCSYVARYILFVAELVSSIPFAVLYMNTRVATEWLLASYVLFGLIYILGFAKVSVYIVLAAISFASALILMHGNALFHKMYDSINILDVGQGQCVAVLTEDSGLVIDCGNINSIDNAGEEAAAYLYSRGRNSIDYLVLSHLHEDHAGGAAMLMEMIDVDTVVFPADCDKTDELYIDIVESAKRNGTRLLPLKNNQIIRAGEIEAKLLRTGFGYNENERCIIVNAQCNGVGLLAMADSTWKMEKHLCEEYELSDVDVLIVSHHGSKYSSTEELLEELGGGYAVISVGSNYFGHPAEETLEALESYGYNIYRTDIHGDIEFRIGKNYGQKNWEERHKIKLPR